MTSNSPTVSVVIPALHAAGTLPKALESVSRQTYPNIVEVIVAAGDAETATVAAGSATVVRNPSHKTPTALNLAIAESEGEVIVRCDAQSRLPAGYVAKAVETLIRTEADVVGGMQVPIGITAWEQAIAAAMSSRLGAGDARYRTGGEEGPVETVYLGVFRRDSLDRIGGFDEDFVRNQDYELNHRVIEGGGTVWFDPELRVEYRPRSSLAALARQYAEYGTSKRRFSRKHPGSLRWRQLLPTALVLAMAASAIVSLWWPLAILIPLLYGIAMLGAGFATEASPWRVALALVTMHLSWGTGFLIGTDSR